MRDKNICVRQGVVWEKSKLHLKSAIPKYSRFDVTKQIALDLLKKQVK